ncbi:MAG: exodeoxyribonuclease VII large subunit [Candidatus Omnitrophota bacterium]
MMELESIRLPYTVSELTEEIRLCLEERYDWVEVRGEISNFKKAPSGHVYFRMKDENAALECVAWRQTAMRWGGMELRDGAEVIAGGKIGLYPPRGQYQLVVSSLRLAGAGALQLRFEALKRKLAEEGLFDSARKRPLPYWPENIAVVTSPGGAALRDFVKTLREGGCPAKVMICPVLVQGEKAAGEISKAIAEINRRENFDLIVLCRGGGSLEDLWAFNEEAVARAIFTSRIPILTGVGHEIDFTIADFAADARASTPTGAASAIREIFERRRGELYADKERFLRTLPPVVERLRERIELTHRALKRYHPIAAIAMRRQRLDDIQSMLTLRMREHWIQAAAAQHEKGRRIADAMRRAVAERKNDLRRCEHLLRSYDPRRNLARGYAICRGEDGNIIRRIAQTAPRDRIDVFLADGSFASQVTEVRPAS